MKITRKSMYSGMIYIREINVTQEQLDEWTNTHALIQDVMPHLSADDREFLMTGITPDEWKSMFTEEEK